MVSLRKLKDEIKPRLTFAEIIAWSQVRGKETCRHSKKDSNEL